MTSFELALLIVISLLGIAALNATGRGPYWRPALWLMLLSILVWLVWSARQALLPFAVGAIFAYALTPLVDRIAAVFPVHSHRGNVFWRGVAVLIVYLLFGAMIVGAAAIVIPIAADQITQFIDELPDLIDEARAQTSEWLQAYRDRVPAEAQEQIDAYAEDAAAALQDQLASASDRVVALITGTVTILFGFLIVPFWLFYALRDRHNATTNFWNAAPEPARQDLQNAVAIADRLLGRYLRGQLILGVIVGIGVGIGLTILGVELALALAVFAGITELIPIIGPWLGAAPALIIVAATDPDKLIWVALLYLLVQQLENNLLVPRVQGHAVDLHPAMVILLLVVAGTVFGFLGLLVVVPATAMLREFFWYTDHRLRGLTPDEAIAQTHVGRQVLRQRARGSGPSSGEGGLDEPPDEDGLPPDEETAPA